MHHPDKSCNDQECHPVDMNQCTVILANKKNKRKKKALNTNNSEGLQEHNNELTLPLLQHGLSESKNNIDGSTHLCVKNNCGDEHTTHHTAPSIWQRCWLSTTAVTEFLMTTAGVYFFFTPLTDNRSDTDENFHLRDLTWWHLVWLAWAIIVGLAAASLHREVNENHQHHALPTQNEECDIEQSGGSATEHQAQLFTKIQDLQTSIDPWTLAGAFGCLLNTFFASLIFFKQLCDAVETSNENSPLDLSSANLSWIVPLALYIGMSAAYCEGILFLNHQTPTQTTAHPCDPKRFALLGLDWFAHTMDNAGVLSYLVFSVLFTQNLNSQKSAQIMITATIVVVGACMGYADARVCHHTHNHDDAATDNHTNNFLQHHNKFAELSWQKKALFIGSVGAKGIDVALTYILLGNTLIENGELTSNKSFIIAGSVVFFIGGCIFSYADSQTALTNLSLFNHKQQQFVERKQKRDSRVSNEFLL